MEWLRWIVLIVGLLVIGGIVWMYRRHRSEQAVDLGGGHAAHGSYHDPIDASVGARVEEDVEDLDRALDAGEPRREPSLDLDEAREERADSDGFVDGVSRARVVRRDEPAAPAGDSAAPVDEVPPADEDAPARPQPGYSSLFTREGQVGAQEPEEPAVDDDEPSLDEPVEEEGEGGGAVISMILVDRAQRAMPAEQVRRGIEEVGFEFGEFDIFHFQDIDGRRWFSLMNAVAPGRFDPDDLASFETPALALFMQLPTEGADPSLVFDRMHQVATSLAESLDAQLIDDRRQPLDTESIDRYREMIESNR